jgi:putative colanic acid biosynthesis glycosyltransferase WcaI
MRVTLINQFYVPDISPTAHLTASLAEDRARRGDEVTVIASRGGYIPDSNAVKAERESNPRIHRVWTPQLGKGSVLRRCIDYLSFYVSALWRMIRLPRQDVIISLTTPPFIVWTAVAHRLLHPKTKIVLWCMDCYPEVAERAEKLKKDGLAARLMRRMNRAIFRRLDHLICLDTAMVELLMSQYAPKGKDLPVTVIPNWEQASFFPADAKHGRWAKAAELGLDGKFVVLYLGNMGYGHDFATALDAAERLKDEPITFLYIGGGALLEPTTELARRRGLNNVVMHPYIPKDQTPGVMAAVDCTLITLRNDMLGVMSPSKLHSNLAMGLPVIYIGPPKSNVDDAIQRFGCGASTRHGDVDGLVAAIRGLADDKQRHQAMRQKAREAFDGAYCDLQTLPQFEQVIRSL